MASPARAPLRHLRVPAEVVELIGPARAQEMMAGPYPAIVRCRGCDQLANVDDGVAVEVGAEVYQDTTVVWFSHPGCVRGRVTTHPRPVRHPQELVAHGIVYATHDVDGPRPAVVIEVDSSWVTGPDGDNVDLVLGAMCGVGMLPVGDVTAAPVPDGEITWRVALPHGSHGGGVYGRGADGARLALLEPLPPVPPVWPGLAMTRGGRCRLYVASRVSLLSLSGQRLIDGLQTAAAAGRVVGCTAAVT